MFVTKLLISVMKVNKETIKTIINTICTILSAIAAAIAQS